MRRLLFLSLLILPFGPKALAAGGSCPTGANYLNAQGQLVTLASLGVTNCYYIAATITAGGVAPSDSNSGTDELHPWLHSPGMANCSANCAAITTGSPEHLANPAGYGFIFKGGDTWHTGNSSLSPFMGTTSNCAYNGTTPVAGFCFGEAQWKGTPSNYIYFGVDPNWPSTGWSRPIISADNPLTPHPGTYLDYVSSCSYQTGTTNIMVEAESSAYLIFDDFELTGLCQNGALVGAGGSGAAINYYFDNSGIGDIYSRIYAHGWTHVGPYSCTNVAGTATGLCELIRIYSGPYILLQDIVDGSDSDPGGAVAIFAGGYIVAQSVFRYANNIVIDNDHLWHDNLLEHWACPGDQEQHPNMVESTGSAAGTDAVYNNVFRYVATDAGFCPIHSQGGLWTPELPAGSTGYLFNNLFTSEMYTEYTNIGSNTTSASGTWIYFNNTFEDSGAYVYGCAGQNPGESYSGIINNNHHIFDGSSVVNYGTANGTCNAANITYGANNLTMSHQTATKYQYLQTASQAYAYAPATSNSPTVGKGANLQAYCTALSIAAASDSTLSNAAAACTYDTTYACSYNSSNHTVTCPGRSPVARPGNGAWDVGAYQYSGTQGAPVPPTGLAATVQ